MHCAQLACVDFVLHNSFYSQNNDLRGSGENRSLKVDIDLVGGVGVMEKFRNKYDCTDERM